ncbi:MAG TPA: hypothetical protein VLG76_02070 [Rhabdochlamydiaceae bacterium]|nr:hypothetical protein [Rhabdochlamydiaceae bacterium]
MQIKIAERLHPFSHQSGTFCPIPLTTWEVQVFPARLYFRDLQTYKELDLKLSFKGPVKNFTVQLDLEQGFVRVFGESNEGYIEYVIDKSAIHFKKLPVAGILCGETTVHKGASFPLPIEAISTADSKERLSLGMHRSQDWELVKRRSDLKEIFPVWLRLAALIPNEKIKEIPDVGTLTLLHACKKAVEQNEKNQLCGLFNKVFEASFQGILSPRLSDELFLGLVAETEIPSHLSPLIILHEGAKLIRSLFFREEMEMVSFLPHLPPEFHSGRFVIGDEIAIEWSKKLLKKVIWKSKRDRQIILNLQRPIQSFRLRHFLKDRGIKIAKDQPFFLKAGQLTYLDRFEK